MDRRYLTMIADIYNGGPVGVETLAAGLAEPRDTIEDVIEPFLIQLGLIARTARGRCLNGRGWTHLGLNPPAGRQTGLFDPGAAPSDRVLCAVRPPRFAAAASRSRDRRRARRPSIIPSGELALPARPRATPARRR